TWYQALQCLVKRDPEYAALINSSKYGRTILLERYCPMGTFDSFSCGQLRTVEIYIAGPGDPSPWMTVTLRCSGDNTLVGTAVIRNDRALASRQSPMDLREFSRLDRFLDTGKFREPFRDQLARLGEGLLTALLIPVNILLFSVGVFIALLRGILTH